MSAGSARAAARRPRLAVRAAASRLRPLLQRPPRRGAVLAAAAAAAIGLITGCGGSGGASHSGDPGSGSKSAVASAQRLVDTHLAPPSSIGNLPPLRTRPPTGKTVMYLDCGVPVCALEGEGVAAAAQAVGWHYKHVVEGTAPNTIASAWNQAVQQKPTAVIAVATPEAEFANQLAKLRAMGIPYVAEATTDPPGKNGLVAVISTQRDEKERGGWQAAWIAADSKGKANTVLFNVPSFPVLKQLAAAFEAEYRKACPGCKLDVVNVSVNSIGTSLPSQVVSYLESHPDVDYVSMAFADETLGVPEAITAAGLASRVKMVSQNGTPEDFTAIAKGNVEAADVPTAEKLEGWYEMDAALRAVEHMPEPQSVYDSPPRQILIKSNVTDPSQPYVGVPGYPTKFEKLWKVK